MFEKVRLKPKVSGTFCGSGSGSWGTWSTLSSLAPRVPTQTRSLYLHSFRQNFPPLPQAGSAGGMARSFPSAEETLAFDLWCKFERGLAQSSWRTRWIGRGVRPRRLPAGESTRHPLCRDTATASSTGLSAGAGLHPSSSPPSPGHPWLLPREGQAELRVVVIPGRTDVEVTPGKLGRRLGSPFQGGGGCCSALSHGPSASHRSLAGSDTRHLRQRRAPALGWPGWMSVAPWKVKKTKQNKKK